MVRFKDLAWSSVPYGNPKISNKLMIRVQVDFRVSKADWRRVMAFLLAFRLSSTSDNFVFAEV